MRRSPLARTLTAVAAAVLVGSALTGCSGLAFGGGCEVAPGDASRAVTATGDLGASPSVEFPTPLIVDRPEASVLAGANGEPIPADSAVLVNAVYFDAQSGTSIGETPEFISTGESGLALGAALACATDESRVAVVGPAGELSSNTDLTSAVGEDATIVAVLDVQQVFLGKANGINQLPQDGMPTVVTAVDGTPGISSTYLPAVEETRTAVIKAGGGAVVSDEDSVVLHARSWNWTAGSTSNVSLGQVDTWAGGRPGVADLSADSPILGEQAIADALIGSKVGSQLLIVIPSADDPTAATVYVFDVLGILAQD